MNKEISVFFVILLFGAIFLSLFALGKWSLMDYDEATYAEVLHESLKNQDLLSLTYGGGPWFEKPPLYFWLAGVSTAILGESEFALRLPSALCIILSITLVWFITFELTKSKRSAFFSSVVLLSTAYFVFAGRQVRFDVPVISAILLSFYSFIKGLKNPKWFLGFGLGLAVGILFKSIIGILVLPIIFIFSLVYREWKWTKDKFFWASTAFAFLLILPWHLYESIKFGNQFWDEYLFTHVLGRVTGNLAFGEEAPFLYHLKQLFIVAQPWFLSFLFLGIFFVVKYRSKIFQQKFEIFNLIVALFILIIFHIPGTILLYYFIPMFPFLAMFVGSNLEKALRVSPRFFAVLIVIIFILGFANAFLMTFSNENRGFFLQSLPKISRYMLTEEERVVAEKIKQPDIPFYEYKWTFFPTIIYYSGMKKISAAAKGDRLNPPFFLLMPRPLFKNIESMPVRGQNGLLEWKTLYSGSAAMLFRAD